MKCRHCGGRLEHRFIDLGFAPPSNAYLQAERLCYPELHYPLRVKVCHRCWLVQTEDYARADELFGVDYAYFSSTSATWLDHAARYARMVTERLQLGPDSFVIEVASNDGYLLKNFVAANIPCLGIEPTATTAAAAEARRIPVRREFFGEALGRGLANEGRRADLVVGNNVYAHVPDINDFTRGLAAVLKPEGTVTLEFPHLMPLIEQTQFDTIYHEHFSYFSLYSAEKIFAAHGLRIFDVDQLSTHGGSLRIYACHEEDRSKTVSRKVISLRAHEEQAGVSNLESYSSFTKTVEDTKYRLLEFLIQARREGKQVAGYGAPGKGNTLLNYCGVRSDLLPYTVDRNPYKHGKFLPGSHIPIFSPERIRETKPDYILILPWNLKDEIMQQLSYAREWGARFVVPIPEVQVYA
jgi:SAM-dependent methyltransferase